MQFPPVTADHHVYIYLKDGRDFTHECDGKNCQIQAEMEAAGFECPVPARYVEYAAEGRLRGREPVNLQRYVHDMQPLVPPTQGEVTA